MLVTVIVGFGAPCGPRPTRAEQPDDGTDDSRSLGDPASSPDFLPRCVDLLRDGRHVEARELLEPAVARHPDWAGAKLYLALTYNQDQRWETAKHLFEDVLRLDPDLRAVHVPYGWCLYYLGRLDAARQSFETYLETEPDYADAIFALALIDFDNDDLTSAGRRFRKVIKLAESEGDATRQALARARLADVHVRAGDLKRAREELTLSIRLDPGNPKAYFKLSRVLQLLGDSGGAEKALGMHAEILARSRVDERTAEP